MSRDTQARFLPPLLAAALLAAAPAAASAQADFPNRPIRIIVPLAPGGTADTLPRMVGEKLTLKWGQPVIVENKPGGALHLATEHVFRSAPDGYTLLLAPQGPIVLSPNLYAKLGYDPAAFVPVTIMARLPYLFVVNPKVPVSTIPELIAYAKANPDKLNFGTPGVGTAQHLAIEWFKTLAGVRLTHVPYRGAAPAMTDLLAGHVAADVRQCGERPASHQGRQAEGARDRRAAAHPGASRCAGAWRNSSRSSSPRAGSASWRRRKRRRPSPPSCRRPWRRPCACPTWPSACTGSAPRAVGSTPDETTVFLRQETERWRKVIRDAGIKLQ